MMGPAMMQAMLWLLIINTLAMVVMTPVMCAMLVTVHRMRHARTSAQRSPEPVRLSDFPWVARRTQRPGKVHYTGYDS